MQTCLAQSPSVPLEEAIISKDLEIRYPNEVWELLLVIYEENEERKGVLQSDFEENYDDVTKKMKTNRVLKSL